MSLATSVWFGLIGILLYVYLVDPNVQEYLSLFLVRLSQLWRRSLYSLRWNPRFPWARAGIWYVATRNGKENARELAKELGMKD